jgi:hypothetical protein
MVIFLIHMDYLFLLIAFRSKSLDHSSSQIIQTPFSFSVPL